MAPGDADELWTALKASNSVEKALQTSEFETPEDRKYLEALAESYENAQPGKHGDRFFLSWQTKLPSKRSKAIFQGLLHTGLQEHESTHYRVRSWYSLAAKQKS